MEILQLSYLDCKQNNVSMTIFLLSVFLIISSAMGIYIYTQIVSSQRIPWLQMMIDKLNH